MISINLPNDEANDFANILYTCVELDYPIMNVDLVEKVIKQIEEKLEWED